MWMKRSGVTDERGRTTVRCLVTVAPSCSLICMAVRKMDYEKWECIDLHGKDVGYDNNGWFMGYNRSNGKLVLEVNGEYEIELDNDTIVKMYKMLKKYCEGKE